MILQDGAGRKFGETYSLILTDPTFEKRLKAFDPNLKLMFDQNRKRWCVLELAPDNSGYNLLITAEDENGAKPLGQWVFNKLFVWRHNYEEKQRNFNQWFKDLEWKADWDMAKEDTKISLTHQNILKDERTQWKKANRELKNLPVSDVTAGYPKIKYNQGEIICP